MLLVCGMTAIGLGVSLRGVRTLGWGAFLAAALVAISVGCASILRVSRFAGVSG
jgi:uncharacterized membrane protein YadS